MAKKKASSHLPKSVRDFFARAGRKGGSATGPTKARDPEAMSKAAKKRWQMQREKQQDKKDGLDSEEY